jgi:hypothetical protein
MGNFLGAGLVVGQFVRQGPVSVPVLVGGFVGWLLLQARLSALKRKSMTNAVLVGLTFGIGGLIFAILINVIGNRQRREFQRRGHSS